MFARTVVHDGEGGGENNLFNIHGKKILKHISSANIKLPLLYRLVKKYIIF